MDFNYEKVRFECEDNIATITLNNPKALNAVAGDMMEGMGAALSYIEDPANGVRCLVITGEGRGFCAGASFDASSQPKQGGGGIPDMGGGLETAYHPVLRRLRMLECPIITSVNGPAAGVGMALALTGDIVLAARSAIFMQAFRHRGLVPDGGSTWLLPRLVGMARAKELTMLGEKLSAETALEWGLINRLCDDNQLKEATAEMAKNLAEGPFSLRYIRQMMWDSMEHSYEEQLNMERQMQKRAGRSADAIEGIVSFVEKRPSQFKGK